MKATEINEKTSIIMERLNKIIKQKLNKRAKYSEMLSENAFEMKHADMKYTVKVTSSLVIYIIVMFLTALLGLGTIATLLILFIEIFVIQNFRTKNREEIEKLENSRKELINRHIQNEDKLEKTKDIKQQLLVILKRVIELNDPDSQEPFIPNHPLAALPEDTTKMTRKLEKAE